MKSITLTLLALIWIIFFFQLAIKGEEYVFGMVPSKALRMPWMFITSIFLHDDSGLSHIFYNSFGLFMFGIYLEREITKKQYLILFLLSGILGNVFYFFINYNPNIPAVGASGAIYGLIGALAVLRPSLKVYVYYMPVPLIFLAFFYMIHEFLGIFIPSPIASQAHFAGLVFGMVFGYLIKKEKKKHVLYVFTVEY